MNADFLATSNAVFTHSGTSTTEDCQQYTIVFIMLSLFNELKPFCRQLYAAPAFIVFKFLEPNCCNPQTGLLEILFHITFQIHMLSTTHLGSKVV